MPVLTSLQCPVCNSPVRSEPCSSVSYADCDGDPVETVGMGYFCTSPFCEHNAFGIEPDDFETLPA